MLQLKLKLNSKTITIQNQVYNFLDLKSTKVTVY